MDVYKLNDVSRQTFPRPIKWYLVIAVLSFLMALLTPGAWAGLTLNVLQPGSTPGDPPVAFTGSYRWLIEKDLNFAQDPDGGFLPDPNLAKDVALGLNFHRSYMPVVASGNTADGQLPTAVTLEGNTRYFVSVLPGDAGTDPGHTLGGASFETGGSGDATAKVLLNKLPLPTAQIRVFVFEDTRPINNAPDLPQEQGLAGFRITLEEPCGRYGACGGQVSQDAFGEPLVNSALDGVNDPGQAATLGTIVTDENGVALIKNLLPAKYGIIINPPIGQGWMQTTTLEGSPVIDAWVKPNEPAFFTEFGPPGPHVFVGFVREFDCFGNPNSAPELCRDGNGDPVYTGGAVTIQGQVVSTHLSRSPETTFYPGAVFPDAIVGLNDLGRGAVGVGAYMAKTFGDSQFAIPSVPPGTYQLAIFDDALDMVFAGARVTVNPDGSCDTVDGSCNLGKVGVFSWFAHMQGNVFYDVNGDGYKDPIEDNNLLAAPSAINIRWRDGTIYANTGTSAGTGFYRFSEVFPFFAWLVAEVDFGTTSGKATGVTVIPDAGGPVLPGDGIDPIAQAHQEYDWPSYGVMTPQGQGGDVTGAPFTWTEAGEVLTLGMQTFLGQTNIIHWGKKEYEAATATLPAENGGISGMVFYKTTRAEPNPEDDVGFPHEPGVPRVQVNLYTDTDANGQIDELNGVPGIQLADVDNYPFGWSIGGAKGAEDVENSGTDAVFDLGDAIDVTWTDSWDDNQPDGCPGDPTDPFFNLDGVPGGDCYDGLRNFNQVRPAVFDGGYAFGGYNQDTEDGLVAGTYIVEAVPPPNYEIVNAEDLNVVFGDTLTPALEAFPLVPSCVGEPYEVPEYLSLLGGEKHPWYDSNSPIFRGAYVSNTSGDPTINQWLNACDRKQVYLSALENAAADFNIFTQVPVSARVRGFILNDLANEFNPLHPNFGEKFAPPFVPVSFKDYNGVEITRVYSDQYGSYNALVPSTYTANAPIPSGMGPNMLIACMNDPGPIPDPANPGQFKTDPYFKPQYTQFCYTFQYMPGVTTYLDTPVEPIAAFAGQLQNPLDCEFADGTPVIRMVTGDVAGPWVAGAGQTLTIEAMGSTAVPDPSGAALNIDRDYGFGTTPGSVTIGGVALADVDWGAGTISATVPAGAQTGQLMITRGDNNRSTVMGVTVTVGGTAPVVVAPGGNPLATPITDAIEAAGPGDLIIVGEGVYPELVIMSKPVRLQGAGAGAVTINAVKSPGDKLLAWRDRVKNLIATGIVDALPGQEAGVDPATGEPLFLTTHEGAGISVFGKGTGRDRFGRHTSRIDGITITGGDTGGGIFVNAYADNLRISNNRVSSNAGIEGGGIAIGPRATADGPENARNSGITIAYNHITQNGGRVSGAGGGVSVYTGAKNYAITDCYICGNFTKGSGGGIGHEGFSDGGLIADNTIIFNQTFIQTLGTGSAGGGIAIGGFPVDPGALTQGAGSVTIERNLLQGNLSGVGDGGAIMLKLINGTDVEDNPDQRNNLDPWHAIVIRNNMIVNNVAADAGGGIAMKDAADVRIYHNTIASNDSTATAGALIKTPDQLTNPDIDALSDPQPAGVVSRAHSPELVAVMPLVGPGNNRVPLQTFSDPEMVNNIVWQNRSFYWAINADGDGVLRPMVGSSGYWDLAVLGVAGQLNPAWSILTSLTGPDTADYNGNNNITTDPSFTAPGFNNNGTLSTIPENATPLTAPATDEGGNFIDVRFGPLTLWNDPTPDDGNPGSLFRDYHIGSAVTGDSLAVPDDFDGDARPASGDIGADEIP